jgi:hypothetical protein
MLLPQGLDLHKSISTSSLRCYMSFTSNQRDQITCFRCGEQGHVKAECMIWKVRLCANFNNGLTCYSSECSFAHGDKELRTPWTPKCIRITKRDGALVVLGCGSLRHTFRNCPENKT